MSDQHPHNDENSYSLIKHNLSYMISLAIDTMFQKDFKELKKYFTSIFETLY